MHRTLRCSGPLLLLLPLLGCGGKDEDSAQGAASPCEEETRAAPLAEGSTFAGSAATLTITAVTPRPAASGDNTWTLRITDGSGAPLDGCTITAESSMPDHGHSGPAPTVTSDGGGSYTAQVTLTMSGYWELDTALSCPSGVTDTVFIAICAE